MFRRTYLTLVAFACVLAVSFVLPAAGSADSSLGPKVSSQLAAAATAPGVTASTPLHAIVYGTDLPGANTDLGSLVQIRQALGAVGGESVTVTEGNLGALTAEPGVSYVTLDPSIASTGAVTKAPIAGTALVTVVSADRRRARRVAERHHRQERRRRRRSTAASRRARLPAAEPARAGQAAGTAGRHGPQRPVRPRHVRRRRSSAADSVDGHFIGIAPSSNLDAINLSRPDGAAHERRDGGAPLGARASPRTSTSAVVNLSLTETTASSYLQSPLDAVVERLWRAGVASSSRPGTRARARPRTRRPTTRS